MNHNLTYFLRKPIPKKHHFIFLTLPNVAQDSGVWKPFSQALCSGGGDVSRPNADMLKFAL